MNDGGLQHALQWSGENEVVDPSGEFYNHIIRYCLMTPLILLSGIVGKNDRNYVPSLIAHEQ